MPDERFANSTRGRVLNLIHRGVQTVDELARSLDLTANAVRAHLNVLERDGLIRQQGQRRGFRKPFLSYVPTELADHLLHKPYDLVLNRVLDNIARREGIDTVDETLRRVGLDLAESYAGRFRDLTPKEKVAEAARIIGELGGIVDVVEGESSVLLRGHSCPLVSIVAEHPAACALTQEFLSTLLAPARVSECCQRSGPVQCLFSVELSPDQTSDQ